MEGRGCPTVCISSRRYDDRVALIQEPSVAIKPRISVTRGMRAGHHCDLIKLHSHWRGNAININTIRHFSKWITSGMELLVS